MAAAKKARTDYSRAADRSAPTPKAPGGSKAPRTKPVRVTLDLPPTLHRELKRFCAQSALDLDLNDVPLAQVLRAMGRTVLEDEDIAASVLERLMEDIDNT